MGSVPLDVHGEHAVRSAAEDRRRRASRCRPTG